MLLVFCNQISPRITYAVSIVFDLLHQSEYTLTDDKSDFINHEGVKLNYSGENFEGLPTITPSGFLDGPAALDGVPAHGEYNGITHLFPNNGSLIPYDVFSAVFYMLCRYEEYGDFKGDKHGRFPLEENLAYKLGFHQKAIVHHWCRQLTQALNQIYPDLIKSINSFEFEIGMDIDNAYAYKHKGPLRTFGALIQSVLNPSEFIERMSVLMGIHKDPYDNYEYIFNTLSRFKTELKVFFLCAEYGSYDKNISPHSKAFKDLVINVKKYGEIGIHPSYRSNSSKSLGDEVKKLREISGENVQISRQHYLMMSFPETYSSLLNNGLKHDYSMGYAEGPGFRAGIAVPFPFYNLKEEIITDLIIHPFVFMESGFIHNNRLETEIIKSEITAIMDEVKSVDGVFHAVWHNEYLGGKTAEKWKDIFEFMLEQGSEK